MKTDATDLFETTRTSEIDDSLVESRTSTGASAGEIYVPPSSFGKHHSFSSSTTGSADEGHGHGRGGGRSSGNKSSSNTMLALIAKREQNAVFYSRVVVVIVIVGCYQMICFGYQFW